MAMYHLRAHHFTCIHGFQGKGYSDQYIENFQSILDALKEQPDFPLVQLVDLNDHICQHCPHSFANLGCEQESKVRKLDRSHKSILGIQKDKVYSLNDIRLLIKLNMTIKAFEDACSSCEWKKLGYCESAIRTILKD